MVQKKLNVVYSRPYRDFGVLSPDMATMIEAVSPRVKLWDISELISMEIKGNISARNQVDEILSEAEVFYGFPPPRDLITRAPRLRWIQDILAGVETFLSPSIISSPVVLTNARGIHQQVTESALTMMLMLAKRMDSFGLNQRAKIWQKSVPGHLYSRTVGILGLGHIGSEIAQITKSLRMKTMALDIREMRKPGYIDALLTPDRLPDLLSQSDFLVLTLPFTPQTTRLIGEKEFRMMKPAACVINISRGGVLDEEVLIKALREKWIAGAGLDVFASEPLPVNSPLWELPNVIITPHVAGLSDDYDIKVTQLFCKNLKRYLSGRELLKVVDKTKGY